MRHQLLLVLCVALLTPDPCLARERWNVCLAELDGLASSIDGRGAYYELFDVLRAQAPEIDWVLRVQPFARSVYDVQHARCDLHMPFIRVQEPPAEAHFGIGLLGSTYFVVYSRRASGLTLAQLQDSRGVLSAQRIEASGLPTAIAAQLQPLLGRYASINELQKLLPETAYRQQLQGLAYPYRLDANRAHQYVLGLPVMASASVQASLQRLIKGRIDGYIDAATMVEPLIDALGLRNDLRAELFAVYQFGWLRSASERGRQADAAFWRVLQPVQASGEYDQIIDRHINRKWQPWP